MKKKLKKLAEEWRYRKGSLSSMHHEANEYDRGKAHIYGICAKELLKVLEEKS